jgi:hypothetical protein
MLSMNVSAVRIDGVGDIEDISGFDGYTCWRIDKTDRENNTQEAIKRLWR